MLFDKLANLENTMNPEELIRFIVILGFNLTVVARNTYKICSDEVNLPVSLRGLNEIEHRVLSQAMHLLNGTQGCPYKSFINQIIDLSDRYNCTLELENAVTFAFEYVAKLA